MNNKETTIYELKLNPYQIAIYGYLLMCNFPQNVVLPSYATIAEKCGMSKRKAINTVKELVEKNLLIKIARMGEDDDSLSNIYIVKQL